MIREESEEYDNLNGKLKCPDCGEEYYGSTYRRHECPECGRTFIGKGDY